METHNVLSPPNRAIYGFSSLWVEGHALVAGLGRPWKFQHRNLATNWPVLAAGGGHTIATGSEGPLAIKYPGVPFVFHFCPGRAPFKFHPCSVNVPRFNHRQLRNGTKWNKTEHRNRWIGRLQAKAPPVRLSGSPSCHPLRRRPLCDADGADAVSPLLYFLGICRIRRRC